MNAEEIKQGYEDSVSKEEQSVEGYIEYLEKYVVQLSKTNEGILKRLQSQPKQLSDEEIYEKYPEIEYDDKYGMADVVEMDIMNSHKREAAKWARDRIGGGVDAEDMTNYLIDRGVLSVDPTILEMFISDYLTQRNQQNEK